jgi:hypothetical protein
LAKCVAAPRVSGVIPLTAQAIRNVAPKPRRELLDERLELRESDATLVEWREKYFALLEQVASLNTRASQLRAVFRPAKGTSRSAAAGSACISVLSGY